MSFAQVTRRILQCGLAVALFAAGCGGNDFTLSSPDIRNGTIQNEQVANVFGCTGGNVSPELRWSNPPSGTQSFAITVHDPDAPTGSGFWHWAAFDIPASATSLPKNAGNVSAGAAPTGTIQGFTDFAATGYGGPCPPAGDPAHRYVFTIYALKVASLGLDNTAPGALVSFAAKGNAIGSASFTANYGIQGPATSHPPIPTAAGFTLASNTITGGTIPTPQVFNQFGCTGSNTSPELHWTAPPAGTQSLVLEVYDPDAPTDSGFWHWVIFNIPPTQTSIPAGAGIGTTLPGGSAVQGTNDYGARGYGGPCPPAGAAPHRYQFTLYAVKVANLKTAAGLPDNATGALVGFATRANATAQATFQATYGR